MLKKETKVRNVVVKYGKGYDVVKKPKKKIKNYDHIFPSGRDDGSGPNKLISQYVDEVLTNKTRLEDGHYAPLPFTKFFNEASFLQQIKSVEIKNMPLVSQIAAHNSLVPKHSTEKRKFFIDYSDRLKKNQHTLVIARLNDHGVDDQLLGSLCTGLEKNKVLQQLSLHNNYITDDGIKQLSLSLRWHPTLHTLRLGRNRYTDIGVRHLSLLLRRNKLISDLNLSNKWPSEIWARSEYELHPHVTYVGAQYLATELRRGKTGLTNLSLMDQRIRDDGASMIFSVLPYCQLRSLNLTGNELSNRCCNELGRCLSFSPVLDRLILSRNNISDTGCSLISYGLSNNRVLAALDLSKNQIGRKGLEDLFLCLQYNQTIETLVTINNKYDDLRAEKYTFLRNKNENVWDSRGSTRGNSRQRSRPDTGLMAISDTKEEDCDDDESSEYETEDSEEDFVEDDKKTPLNVPTNIERKSSSKIHKVRPPSASLLENYEKEMIKHLRKFNNEKSIFAEKIFESLKHFQEGETPPTSVPSSPFNPGQGVESIVPGIGILGKSPFSRSFRQQRDSMENNDEFVKNWNSAGSCERISSPQRNIKHSLPPLENSSPHPMLRKTSMKGSQHNLLNSSLRGRVLSRQNTKIDEDDVINSGESSKILGGDSKEKYKVTAPLLRSPSKNLNSSLSGYFSQAEMDLLIKGEKKSKDLGKKIGIPHFKNVGIKPIRSSISSHHDSGQHTLYLRVSTKLDKQDDRPYPVVSIGSDWIKENQKVRKQRQTTKYKLGKQFIINNAPKRVVHESAKPRVPASFFKAWNKKIRLQYLDGIDNASGVTSTKLEEITLPIPRQSSAAFSFDQNSDLIDDEKEDLINKDIKVSKNVSLSKEKTEASITFDSSNRYMAIYAMDPSLSYQKHLNLKKNRNITPGQILAARRKEQKIQKEQNLLAESLSEKN